MTNDMEGLWARINNLNKSDRRSLVLRLLRDDSELVTFRRNGLLWTGFAWDEFITWPLFCSNELAGGQCWIVSQWLKDAGYLAGRDTIVNVGAHIGTSSIPLALWTGCHVLAVEPVPDNMALLQQNVNQNNLQDRITCVQSAIGSEPGTARMVLPVANSGGAELQRPGVAPSFGDSLEEKETIEVTVDRLDNIQRAHQIRPEQVALVWSDVQGCEADVIQSASSLWLADVPLYMELDPKMLRLQNGLDTVIDLVPRLFVGFTDRDELNQRGLGARFRPASDISGLLEHLDRVHMHSDVLLLPG
jgi:FkbM family methyltransferase